MGKSRSGWRRSHVEVGQHFSETNILVVLPEDNTTQYRVSAGMRPRSSYGLYGGIKTAQALQSPLTHFQKDVKNDLHVIANLHRK